MSATRILLTLFAILFIASFPLDRRISSFRAQAQQSGVATAGGPGTAQPQTPQPDPPGTIDGAKSPELIPDEVAYRLVLVALAEREEATESEKARFRAKISPARLDEQDTDAVFHILAAFQKQLDALDAQARPIQARNPFPYPGSVDYQKLLELSLQRQGVFAEAMSAVPARLSVDGAAKLQAHVQNAKQGMKYLPEKPMAGQ
jgi:hypothetical protein